MSNKFQYRFCFAKQNNGIQVDKNMFSNNALFYSNSDIIFVLEDMPIYDKINLQKIESGGFIILERIFKKEILTDKIEHKDTGYLVSAKIKNIKTEVATLALEPSPILRAEYIQIHSKENRWPQIIDNMNSVGVIDMELYLWDYQAFLVTDLPLNFSMEAVSPKWIELPMERAWQNYVSKFQKTGLDKDSLEKWKPLSLITH